MLFCSLQYLYFFVAIFTLYWLLPWKRPRVYLLLVASFYFYASWNRWLAALICFSTTIDYFLALGIERASGQPRLKKLLLTVNILGNLGLLCYFKYANFFLDSLRASLEAMGQTASLPVLSVILPVGISFYTFEAINYMVDVYRGHVRAERNLANFMLFILFFPHLVAGPIVRARDFLPQIHRPKHFDWLRMQLGVQYFLMGLFKKVAIADRMALFADPIFADPSAYNTGAIWMAVVAYALQIYCDFSGYTDMALGSAHMLGYKLAQNFNMPYLARNISEFWRRWHISLSSWLRDYLFIPLGGSRGGKWLTYRNLLVTMTLGGLWHGASWTFVVWGVLHGGLLIGHKVFSDATRDWSRLKDFFATQLGWAVSVLTTFLAVCIGWVFFRAQTFEAAAQVLRGMVWPQAGLGAPMAPVGLFWTVVVVAFCHYAGWTEAWKRWTVPAPVMGMGYAFLLTVVLLLAPGSNKAFIYFQF
ncbi:MAG: MBOAT family protein [Gemmataceae bacterium]